MRRIGVGVLAFILCTAASAGAGPPRNGVYTSAEGHLLLGRYSESWIDGAPGEVGNTLHAQSWEGVALGTQWAVRCPSILVPPMLISEMLDEEGNGQQTYRTIYTGGTFWISGTGAWGSGDAEYSGDLAQYIHTTTYLYENHTPVTEVTNVQLTGFFDGYGQCMQLTIANAAGVGGGSQGRDPYPEFLNGPDGCCADPSLEGEWGDVHSITMVVLNCNTAVGLTSWGTVKSLYR
jgi:hypothetical protein